MGRLCALDRRQPGKEEPAHRVVVGIDVVGVEAPAPVRDDDVRPHLADDVGDLIGHLVVAWQLGILVGQEAGVGAQDPGRPLGLVDLLPGVFLRRKRRMTCLTGRQVRSFLSAIDTTVDGIAMETFVLHPSGYDGPSRADLAENFADAEPGSASSAHYP